MAEVNMVKAKETYDLLCKMLDNKNWHYDKHDEDLLIKSSVKGDDFPIDFIMRVNPRNQLVSFLSWLPFKADESKRIDIALATCVANYGLADGSFDYNLADGSIMFRLTSSYRESIISEDLLEYMLIIASTTVDKYNDKFFMIQKGMMTIQQFIESENN